MSTLNISPASLRSAGKRLQQQQPPGGGDVGAGGGGGRQQQQQQRQNPLKRKAVSDAVGEPPAKKARKPAVRPKASTSPTALLSSEDAATAARLLERIEQATHAIKIAHGFALRPCDPQILTDTDAFMTKHAKALAAGEVILKSVADALATLKEVNVPPHCVLCQETTPLLTFMTCPCAAPICVTCLRSWSDRAVVFETEPYTLRIDIQIKHKSCPWCRSSAFRVDPLLRGFVRDHTAADVAGAQHGAYLASTDEMRGFYTAWFGDEDVDCPDCEAVSDTAFVVVRHALQTCRRHQFACPVNGAECEGYTLPTDASVEWDEDLVRAIAQQHLCVCTAQLDCVECVNDGRARFRVRDLSKHLEKHIAINTAVDELAQQLGFNFLDTDEFQDTPTGERIVRILRAVYGRWLQLDDSDKSERELDRLYTRLHDLTQTSIAEILSANDAIAVAAATASAGSDSGSGSGSGSGAGSGSGSGSGAGSESSSSSSSSSSSPQNRISPTTRAMSRDARARQEVEIKEADEAAMTVAIAVAKKYDAIDNLDDTIMRQIAAIGTENDVFKRRRGRPRKRRLLRWDQAYVPGEPSPDRPTAADIARRRAGARQQDDGFGGGGSSGSGSDGGGSSRSSGSGSGSSDDGDDDDENEDDVGFAAPGLQFDDDGDVDMAQVRRSESSTPAAREARLLRRRQDREAAGSP